MKPKAIAKVWKFKSSSSDKTYETLLYTDGATSCGCPGWTRRIDATGQRSCTHIRNVDLGIADDLAENFHDYRVDSRGNEYAKKEAIPKPSIPPQPAAPLKYAQRKLAL